MFKKKVLSFLILSALCLSLGMFATAGEANAADLNTLIRKGTPGGGGGVENIGNTIYGTTADYTSLEGIVVKVINGVLGLLGVIFLALTVYAGFLWMTAQGNDENVKKAKGILTTAIIGIIIIIAAYAITNFVISAIVS